MSIVQNFEAWMEREFKTTVLFAIRFNDSHRKLCLNLELDGRVSTAWVYSEDGMFSLKLNQLEIPTTIEVDGKFEISPDDLEAASEHFLHLFSEWLIEGAEENLDRLDNEVNKTLFSMAELFHYQGYADGRVLDMISRYEYTVEIDFALILQHLESLPTRP